MPLQKTDLSPGAGAEIKSGQNALVHYTGWLYDTAAPENKGKKFDSSLDRNEPFEFPVGGGFVIKGWDEGVVGMKVGGKRRLVIPPNGLRRARRGRCRFRRAQRWCSTSSWWRFDDEDWVDAARLLRAVALILAVSLGGAAQAATLIHAGRVIDGVSDAVKTNQTVVVDAGKITAIEAGFRQPAAGDRVIDLRNGTLLPGLFDMHVHITDEYNRQREIEGYKLNESDVTINGVVYAAAHLVSRLHHRARPR